LRPARALVTLWTDLALGRFVTAVVLPNVAAAKSRFITGMVMMVFPMATGTSPKISEACVNSRQGCDS
jgi:hypothetical protein